MNRWIVVVWVSLMFVVSGCGSSAVRALLLRDAVRAAVCESVLGAADSEASISELEVHVERTTAATFETQAGVEGIFAVTGEASIENSSGVTVHMEGEGLPTADRCLELAAQGFPVYELSGEGSQVEATLVAGATVTGTSGDLQASATVTASGTVASSPESSRQRRVVRAEECVSDTVRHRRDSRPYDSPASVRCVDSVADGRTLWNVRSDGPHLRWQVPIEGGVTECVCDTAASS